MAASIMRDMFNVNWVMRLMVVGMRDDFVCRFRLFLFEAVSDEEDSCKDEGDLGCGEGFESDELDDEEFAEQEFGGQETNDTAHSTASLLFATTCEE